MQNVTVRANSLVSYSQVQLLDNNDECFSPVVSLFFFDLEANITLPNCIYQGTDTDLVHPVFVHCQPQAWPTQLSLEFKDLETFFATSDGRRGLMAYDEI